MENMDVYNPDLFTYWGLRALNDILRGKSYISGEEMTKDDAEVYSLFSGIKPGSEAYPDLCRWYLAVEDKLISSYLGKDCGQAASVEPAAQPQEFTAEAMRMNAHTVAGLVALDDKLCGKSYISGDEMTKDDVEVYALFGGKRPNAKYYPDARRWHRAVSEKLVLSVLGKDDWGSTSGQTAADVKRMLKEKVAEENCGMPDRSRKRKREEDTEEEEKVAKARKEAADDTEEEEKADEETEAADDMEEEEKVDEEREAADDMEELEKKIDEGFWQRIFEEALINTTPPSSSTDVFLQDKRIKMAVSSVNMRIPWTFDEKRSERYKKEIQEYASNLDIYGLSCAECEFYLIDDELNPELDLLVRVTIEADDDIYKPDCYYLEAVASEVSSLMDPWKYPHP